MSNKPTFLCSLGIHQWTPWVTDPGEFQVTKTFSPTYGDKHTVVTGVGHRQRRTCENCNRLELRSVIAKITTQ